MPLPIVRLVLICKATEICLIFCKHKVQSNSCLMSKSHCLANQNKPDSGQWHRVSQCMYSTFTNMPSNLKGLNISHGNAQLPSSLQSVQVYG